MGIEVKEEPSSHNAWLTASVNNQTELAAYVPGDLQHGAATVSVFWRGLLARDWLREKIGQAEALSRDELFATRTIQATLVAFGSTRELRESRASRGLSAYLAEDDALGAFPAYRAEFRGVPRTATKSGELLIWANVVASDRRSLSEGGENVGVAVSSALFTPAVRGFISTAITETYSLKKHVITDLFAIIAKMIVSRDLSAAI